MSRGVNKVILIGHVGREPETHYAPSGGAVTNFSVATSENWKDKETGEKKEKTEWHNIVSFRHLADIAQNYLHKGSKVYVEGSLQTSSYEKNGEKRYSTKIVARSIQMLDSPPRSEVPRVEESPHRQPTEPSRQTPAPPPADQPQGSFNETDPFEDDIPF